jgi:hypothetical protein
MVMRGARPSTRSISAGFKLSPPCPVVPDF